MGEGYEEGDDDSRVSLLLGRRVDTPPDYLGTGAPSSFSLSVN